MVAHTFNLKLGKGEAEGSEVQGHSIPVWAISQKRDTEIAAWWVGWYMCVNCVHMPLYVGDRAGCWVVLFII